MSRPSTDELVRRYRAGETLAMIATATGLPRSTVYDRLKRARVELRRPGARGGLQPMGPGEERWEGGK
jgi:DNA-directed RNA polymerase specialized sigma24 family protein